MISQLSLSQEVRETRRRHEKRMVEVDSGTKQDYDYKLAQALQDLRKQHEEQVAVYRTELEHTFKAKVWGVGCGLWGCGRQPQGTEAYGRLMVAHARFGGYMQYFTTGHSRAVHTPHVVSPPSLCIAVY